MFKSVLSLTLAAALGTASFGQTTLTAIPGEAAAAKYASISQEILRAIEKGNEYLKSKQNPEGYWAQPSYPALTALAVTAYMRDPANQGKPVPEYIRKGYDFILKSQKEDGSIFNRGMSSYNTAVCMIRHGEVGIHLRIVGHDRERLLHVGTDKRTDAVGQCAYHAVTRTFDFSIREVVSCIRFLRLGLLEFGKCHS